MQTTISFVVDKKTVASIKKTAKRRGYRTMSDYIRSVLTNDQEEGLISEEEILRRSRRAKALHKAGKLKTFTSLADLLP